MEIHSLISTWTVLEPDMTISPPSISISAILELRVWVIPPNCLRARQDQCHRGRRVRQVRALELEGRVGAPNTDVSLGVGMQVVDRGES